MPLCFAYGAALDRAALARRCPRSNPLGLARLPRHRLAVTRDGLLTAVRDARSAVHGLLWDVALADVPALDRLHGAGYAKVVQPVIAAGGPKRALVYFGANAGPGVLRPDDLARILAAARALDLPAEAIAALERLGPPAVRQPGPIPAR